MYVMFLSLFNFFISLLQECASYLAAHPLKAKAAGRKAVMIPLIRFADDTSGNKSKKMAQV